LPSKSQRKSPDRRRSSPVTKSSRIPSIKPPARKLRRPSPISVRREPFESRNQRPKSPIHVLEPKVQAGPSFAASQSQKSKAKSQSCHKSLVNRQNKRIRALPKVNGHIQVLKLSGVNNRMLLSKLIHEFLVEFSSIIGCHRVADYVAQIKDNVVFLYLTNEIEVKNLLDRKVIIIDGSMITITDPKLAHGHAKFDVPYGPASDYHMRMLPNPMGLFGCRQLPVTTTFYVVAVLRQLEHEHAVTGFKLAYCPKRKLTRNFGFATFLTKKSAFKLYGKTLNIMGDEVQAKLPDGVPILLSQDRINLLREHRCDLNDEIRHANWLNVNLADQSLPMRPLPVGEIFNPPPMQQPRPATTQQPSVNHTSSPQPQPSTSAAANIVVHRNTPPASPTLSIGDDYVLDEEGILVIPRTSWLDANGE
jgi:hypothetical protein